MNRVSSKVPVRAQSVLTKVISPKMERTEPENMRQWFDGLKRLTSDLPSSLDRAILGGRTSTNVGYAFAAGYQSAIERLFGLSEPLLASVCITEEAGNHPRSIQTSLIEQDGHYVLNGAKTFVSGGCDAGFLFVACKVGESDDGRPNLKMVGILAELPGIAIKALPALPFIPEVSHGAVTFADVRIEKRQLLSGDGYESYIKPFRIVEDLHVFAAIASFRLGEAIHSHWKTESIEQHLSFLLTLKSLAEFAMDDPVMHLAFAGCRNAFGELIKSTDTEFAEKSPKAYENWVRDKGLLGIAQKAHDIRTQRAWQSLGWSS